MVYIYGLVHPEHPLEMRYVRYVGKTINTRMRLNDHVKYAKRKGGTVLQAWLRKIVSDGERPQMLILEVCENTGWEDRERYWISRLWSSNNLLNTTAGGASPPLGYRHADISRRRISVSKQGKKRKPFSEEWKQNMANAMRGRKHKPETVEKIRIANLGKNVSPATRRRISRANQGNTSWLGKRHKPESQIKISLAKQGNIIWLGRKHTATSRKKMSLAKKGRPSPLRGHMHTEEARRNMTLGQLKRKPPTQETRRKIAEASLGRLHSEATKLKMSLARKNFYARKKANAV